MRRAHELDRENADALLLLAAIEIDAGRQGQAEQAYRDLSGPPGKKFKTVYPVYLFHEGKRGLAVKELEKLVKQNPNDREFRSLLASTYVAQEPVLLPVMM